MFNYVNELNNQCEILQEEILEVQKEVEQYQREDHRVETERKEILQQLEEKRIQALNSSNEFEEKNRNAKKILDLCRDGLIFTLIRSNSNLVHV